MISIVDASELEHVLRPTVYRPSSLSDRELPRPRQLVAEEGASGRPFVPQNAVDVVEQSLDAGRWTNGSR